jgi:hypothetical protein
MSVRIRVDPKLVIGAPVKLFEIAEGFSHEIDVEPDAKRFLMIRQRREGGRQEPRWILVQNWMADSFDRR